MSDHNPIRADCEVIVLDASAIINTRSIPLLERKAKWLMPNRVYDEVLDSFSRFRADALIAGNQLRLAAPAKETVIMIMREAQRIGARGRLSQADVDVIALAYDERSRGNQVVVVSDDYQVQNLASVLEISFQGASLETITEFIAYKYICPICRLRSNVPGLCENCGTPLRRAIARKRRLLSGTEEKER